MKKMIEKLVLSLGFETLQTRNMDSLDFKEIAVWEIKKALEAAYQAGVEEGKKSRNK